jgi:uncharacterized protein (TIGR00251 family)
MGKNREASGQKSRYPFLEASSDKTAQAVYIRVQVQTRASCNSVAGVHGERGEALKIRLTAPPVEGQANRALVEFLSGLLGVKKTQVEIKAGGKSRTKRVLVKGISLREVERLIDGVIDPPLL